MEHLGREKEYFFKGLDDAVRLLATIGIFYKRLELKQKRQLLLHLIEHVVVDNYKNGFAASVWILDQVLFTLVVTTDSPRHPRILYWKQKPARFCLLV